MRPTIYTNCTTLSIYVLAPTRYGSSLPSSGSFLDLPQLLEIQRGRVVYQITCGYVTCVSDCRGSTTFTFYLYALCIQTSVSILHNTKMSSSRGKWSVSCRAVCYALPLMSLHLLTTCVTVLMAAHFYVLGINIRRHLRILHHPQLSNDFSYGTAQVQYFPQTRHEGTECKPMHSATWSQPPASWRWEAKVTLRPFSPPPGQKSDTHSTRGLAGRRACLNVFGDEKIPKTESNSRPFIP
jgi:hypothetical protein